jgi:SAM-dependent methyltransferase
MPQIRSTASPTVLDWFATRAGHALLRSEAALIQRATQRSRGARALLLSGSAAQGFELPLDVSHLTHLHLARGTCNCEAHGGLGGDLRCHVDALPFGRETFSLIVIWHAELALSEVLLAQLSELLQPEGELLVLGLNRWSLWRWHWQRYRPATMPSACIAELLRGGGFDVHHLSGVGSRWPWSRPRQIFASDSMLRAPWLCASQLWLARLRKPGMTLRPAMRRRAVTVNASLARVSIDRTAECRSLQDDQAA